MQLIGFKSNIVKFFIFDLISQLGSGISFIGLNWYVLQQTGSAESVGVMIILDVLSRFTIGPIAGIITDEFNRKYTLIGIGIFRAVSLLAILNFLTNPEFNITYAYLLSFLGGAGQICYTTTSKAFMQEIVPQNEIMKWQSFLEMSLQSGLLLSGALTGLFYFWGMKFIFLIEATSFLVSIPVLLLITHRNVLLSGFNKNIVQSYVKGYMYLKANSIIFIFAVILILPYVATVTSNTVMPFYALKQLQSDAGTYGMMAVAYGVGGMIAGLTVNYIYPRYPYLQFTHVLLVLSILSLTGLFFNRNVYITYALFCLFGLANCSIKIILQYFLMKNVANEFMGRVLSNITLISTLLQIMAVYFSGVMIDLFPHISCCATLFFIMSVSYVLYLFFLPKFKSVFTAKSYI